MTNLNKAYDAGFAYWQRNKPYRALHAGLASLARSCGWHDAEMYAWLDGFYAAKHAEPYQDAPSVWDNHPSNPFAPRYYRD